MRDFFLGKYVRHPYFCPCEQHFLEYEREKLPYEVLQKGKRTHFIGKNKNATLLQRFSFASHTGFPYICPQRMTRTEKQVSL